jgi:hydrogenase maturation protease
MRTVRVIACGNVDAADDGAGLLAVRSVRGALERLPGVEVAEASTGDAVIDLLAGADAAVLVDAVRSRGANAPGTVVRSVAGPAGLPASSAPVLSTHGVGVGDAVRLAAGLGRAPAVSLIGVEAADTGAGHEMSPPVASSIPCLARRVLAEAERLMKELPA